MSDLDRKNEKITDDYDLTDKEMLNRVEALLFASNTYLDVEIISKYTDLTIKNTRKALKLLEKELESRKSPVVLINENNTFKLSVHKEYAHIVHRVVSETELTKSLIETLAVIAWGNPILQSEIVKYRHNKAYEHLSELEEKGFITRQDQGRSKIVRLTQKFYDYFDVPKKSSNLKDLMPDDVASQISLTENELLEKLDIVDQIEEERQKEKKERDEIKEHKKDNTSLNKFEDDS